MVEKHHGGMLGPTSLVELVPVSLADTQQRQTGVETRGIHGFVNVGDRCLDRMSSHIMYIMSKSQSNIYQTIENKSRTTKQRNIYLGGIGGDLDTMQTMDRRVPNHADVLAQRVGTIDFGGDRVGGGPTAAAAAAAAAGGGGGALAFLVFFSGFLFGVGFGLGGRDEPSGVT
jgi:hypothetical protein